MSPRRHTQPPAEGAFYLRGIFDRDAAWILVIGVVLAAIGIAGIALTISGALRSLGL
jgi:hypothetical protein